MRTRMAVFLVLCFLVVGVGDKARAARRPLQSSVNSGIYIPNELITVSLLRKMPIPLANEDYALYQSIGRVSNIVIGRFKTGQREIILITDKNADGNVDFSCRWRVDDDRLDIDPQPSGLYDAVRFAKMKEDIVFGRGASLAPNPEGIPYMRVLMKQSSSIVKLKNGFRIYGLDPDDSTLERVSYYLADNGNKGFDMAFEVKYINMGLVRISPIINVAAYCKESFDPFLNELIKKLMSEVAEHYRKSSY